MTKRTSLFCTYLQVEENNNDERLPLVQIDIREGVNKVLANLQIIH